MNDQRLPTGWASTTLGALRVDRAQNIDPARTKAERFDLYSIPAFPNGQPDVVHGESIGSTKKSLEPGTVVVSKINPRINRVWVVGENSGRRQIGSSEWIAFFPVQGLQPKYLAYYMRQDAFRNYLAANVSGVGGSLMRVKPTTVDPFPFSLAPTNEQHRIVEAIESYFTRLDDAVATLERVQRNLKHYRASVLKAAVEGRLVPTEAELARAEGRDYEPASVLLERIVGEGRRTPETMAVDLPTLPEGWAWATLGQLADIKGGITKGQKPRAGVKYRDVPYLRVANVQRGYLDLTTVKSISASEDEIAQLRLKPGDVLFNEGGDRDKLGRGWVWKGEIAECIHQNHVFRARVIGGSIIPEFLSWYGNTEGQRYFYDEGKHTTNLASINMTKLRALPVPVPPRSEQLRIFEAVEEKLSVVDDTLKTVDHQRTKCQRLRQSILKWAFEGRLVDQDPTDEPASVLLERIKAERAASAETTKSNRKPRRKGNSANP